MKKIKLLTPILGLATLSGAFIPLASCGCSVVDVEIPYEDLNIVDVTLRGLKDGADISNCTKLVVPSNVKIIDENAFKGVFDGKNKVSTVVIPSNVSEIRVGAFEKCYNVSVFDFSDLSLDDVHNLYLEPGCFGDLSKYNWYANIKMGDNWTDAQKDAFKSVLATAGVPDYWLIEPTEGHVEVENAMEQTSVGGAGTHKFNFLGQWDSRYEYAAVVSKIDSTDGVSAKVTNIEVAKNLQSVKIDTEMTAAEGHTMADGDFVSFKLTVVCIDTSKNNEVKWLQTVETFKLTYEKAPVGLVTEPETVADRHAVACGVCSNYFGGSVGDQFTYLYEFPGTFATTWSDLSNIAVTAELKCTVSGTDYTYSLNGRIKTVSTNSFKVVLEKPTEFIKSGETINNNMSYLPKGTNFTISNFIITNGSTNETYTCKKSYTALLDDCIVFPYVSNDVCTYDTDSTGHQISLYAKIINGIDETFSRPNLKLEFTISDFPTSTQYPPYIEEWSSSEGDHYQTFKIYYNFDTGIAGKTSSPIGFKVFDEDDTTVLFSKNADTSPTVKFKLD